MRKQFHYLFQKDLISLIETIRLITVYIKDSDYLIRPYHGNYDLRASRRATSHMSRESVYVRYDDRTGLLPGRAADPFSVFDSCTGDRALKRR